MHGPKKISARLIYPAHQERRVSVFWPLFSRESGAADSAFCSQAIPRAFLHGGSHAQPPAALLAVLHQAVSRAVRFGTHDGGALCGGCARCKAVSRRPPARLDEESRGAHERGSGEGTL